MKKLLPLLLLLGLCFTSGMAQNQLPPKCHHADHLIPPRPLSPEEAAAIEAMVNRSDTFDILHYDVAMEVDFTRTRILGVCGVHFKAKMDNLNTLRLDLLDLTVEYVRINNVDLTYNYDRRYLDINLPTTFNTGDSAIVEISYAGQPTVDPGRFGGFDFQNGYAYNLGIGLNSNPVNFGRSWHPCFDNFQERATYDFEITSSDGNRAYCSGVFMGETHLGGNTVMRAYHLDQPIPTYLAGIAVSTYAGVEGTHQGVAEELSTLLVAKEADTAAMRTTFVDLPKAIDALEYWYGPYIWGQVGFVTTVRGAMEHTTLIAYPAGVGLGGVDDGQNRLMAHELAHHWFGNMVTVAGPSEMWFKEGNAEYGAHLFTEFAEGETAFKAQVKNNHRQVMLNAHIDDGDYLPLSGIPFEHTYGTHTYYRGASMIHNMRGYLGDSLFRIGQQTILNELLYQSAGAEEYEPVLSQATGVDMSHFFQDWIKSPGYAAYEVGPMDIQSSGNDHIVTLAVEQKLRAAPNYHQQAPVQLSFYGPNGEKGTVKAIADGPSNLNAFRLTFAPEYVVVNEENTLNLAQFHDAITISQNGNLSLPYTDMGVRASNVNEPFNIKVDHYWVGPDNELIDETTARLSSTHYWKVSGDFPLGVELSGNIEYNGLRQPFFDADLVSITEDSIILAYRTGPGEPWVEFDDYRIINLSDTDQNGLVRINTLLPGEYTFANGELPLLTSNTEPAVFTSLQLFPNPTSDYLQIDGQLQSAEDIHIGLVDIQGKELLTRILENDGRSFSTRLQLNQFAAGTYFIHFRNNQGESIFSRQIEVF